MTRGIKYIPTVLIIFFMALLFFSRNYHEKIFQHEIRKIDSAREALQVKVDSLRLKTSERDRLLSKILKRNLEIMDTLNFLQKTLEKDKRAIDKKIEASKEVIDEYWKNN